VCSPTQLGLSCMHHLLLHMQNPEPPVFHHHHITQGTLLHQGRVLIQPGGRRGRACTRDLTNKWVASCILFPSLWTSLVTCTSAVRDYYNHTFTSSQTWSN
jgi:hypothetical protein